MNAKKDWVALLPNAVYAVNEPWPISIISTAPTAGQKWTEGKINEPRM